MKDINNVNIIGRLTKDPEYKQTQNGTKVSNISIAVNGYKDGEVSFFDCVAFSGLADMIQEYCKKGQQVAISGSLKQERWEDQNGNKRSKVCIELSKLQMLGGKTQEQKTIDTVQSVFQNPFDDSDIPL